MKIFSIVCSVDFIAATCDETRRNDYNTTAIRRVTCIVGECTCMQYATFISERICTCCINLTRAIKRLHGWAWGYGAFSPAWPHPQHSYPQSRTITLPKQFRGWCCKIMFYTVHSGIIIISLQKNLTHYVWLWVAYIVGKKVWEIH